MTQETQTLFIFPFASLAPLASLALNPVWFRLVRVMDYEGKIDCFLRLTFHLVRIETLAF